MKTREEIIRECCLVLNTHYNSMVATPLTREALEAVYITMAKAVPANLDNIVEAEPVVPPTDAEWIDIAKKV